MADGYDRAHPTRQTEDGIQRPQTLKLVHQRPRRRHHRQDARLGARHQLVDRQPFGRRRLGRAVHVGVGVVRQQEERDVEPAGVAERGDPVVPGQQARGVDNRPCLLGQLADAGREQRARVVAGG